MEGNFRWKRIFIGSQHLIEDNDYRKTTIDGGQPSTDDNLTKRQTLTK